MVLSPSAEMFPRALRRLFFTENENARKAAWAVHVSKIRVTGLAISHPLGISETGNVLEIA